MKVIKQHKRYEVLFMSTRTDSGTLFSVNVNLDHRKRSVTLTDEFLSLSSGNPIERHEIDSLRSDIRLHAEDMIKNNKVERLMQEDGAMSKTSLIKRIFGMGRRNQTGG